MPTPNVSIVDLVIQVEKKTFAEEVNEAFREYSRGPMDGVLAVTDEPLASTPNVSLAYTLNHHYPRVVIIKIVWRMKADIVVHSV